MVKVHDGVTYLSQDGSYGIPDINQDGMNFHEMIRSSDGQTHARHRGTKHYES
jgi:hypothetical protein